MVGLREKKVPDRGRHAVVKASGGRGKADKEGDKPKQSQKKKTQGLAG